MLVTTASVYLGRHPVGRFLFYLRLFGSAMIRLGLRMVSASLTYQFFVHTELVPRVGC